MTRTKQVNTKFAAKGVVISPALPAKGETVRLVYRGLLAANGAQKVYARFGFGDDWQKAMDYKMMRTAEGFEAALPVAGAATLNVCFRDSADNWDNNSGQNYSFEVSS